MRLHLARRSLFCICIIILYPLILDFWPANMSTNARRKDNVPSDTNRTNPAAKEWQVLRSKTSNLYIFSAFYDIRRQVMVRLMVISEKLLHDVKKGKQQREVFIVENDENMPGMRYYCQIWYKFALKPHISKVTDIRYNWHSSEENNRGNQPYVLSCPVEKGHGVPDSVSLVENPYDKGTNQIKVTYNPPKGEGKKKFAVCVKGLDFLEVDLSLLILEWLEMVLALGADKVFAYEFSVHPNIRKVLNYYISQGKLEVNKISLPGNQPNEEGERHRYLVGDLTTQSQNEAIIYNDCFYKNLYRYEYLTFIDVDEIIVPRNLLNWFKVMDQVPSGYASYCFRMTYFMPDMENQGETSGGHIINSVVRSARHTPEWPRPGSHLVKCFHSTDQVICPHNHFPISCFEDCSFQKNSFVVPVDLAHLHHYRKECSAFISKEDCKKNYKGSTVKDTCFSTMQKDIIKNVTRIMKTLSLSTP